MTSEESDLLTLEHRARELARPRRRETAAESYALFERGGRRYALEQRLVFAIARAVEPTPLPNAAPYWCGISTVRGELLALIDLPVLLADGDPRGGDQAPHDPEVSEPNGLLVLVLGTDRHELGIVIDALHESTSLPLDFEHAKNGDASAQLILGTTRDGTHVVRADALLSDARLFMQTNPSSEE